MCHRFCLWNIGNPIRQTWVDRPTKRQCLPSQKRHAQLFFLILYCWHNPKIVWKGSTKWFYQQLRQVRLKKKYHDSWFYKRYPLSLQKRVILFNFDNLMHLPALHRIQSPCSFRIGSHVSGLTRIIDIGYILGINLETNPMAPKVLSVLAVGKNLKINF